MVAFMFLDNYGHLHTIIGLTHSAVYNARESHSPSQGTMNVSKMMAF